MMSDRDVMLKAGEILSQHGALTADYIIDQLAHLIDDQVAVEDWCRVARAVDVIFDAHQQ